MLSAVIIDLIKVRLIALEHLRNSDQTSSSSTQEGGLLGNFVTVTLWELRGGS
jgi:hypothetical protein